MTVDELIVFSRQNPDVVVDVLHLSMMDLVKFRLADPQSTLGKRKDNGTLFIACEAGAMKGAILAGFAEAMHEHDLQRVIDGGIGSSVGTVAVTGIAMRNPSAGANAQRYLGDKAPYPDTSPDMRYISWGRFARLGPLLEGQVLKDVLDTRAPLDGEFAFPTYAVMSLADGDGYKAEVVRMDDKSVDERHMLRFETMRVPGFMDRYTREHKRWDGAGAAGLPIKQCQELGATHVWALRVEPEKAKAQASMVERTLEQATKWAIGRVEAGMIGYSQVLSRVGLDGESISRWITRSRNASQAQDMENLPANIHVTAMERSTVSGVTTNNQLLAENRVAGFEHMCDELERNLGLETENLPVGWGDEIREDLGLAPDAVIESVAIHEKVLHSNLPAFDPTSVEQRHDARYAARTDAILRQMFGGEREQQSSSAFGGWDRDDDLSMAG